ncbi:MAG: hypothetical protein ACR2ME_04625 [Acidimicrobiia bacterium]
MAQGTGYDPSTGYYTPLGIAIGAEHIDWVSHLELRASDPNVPDGLVVQRFDRRSEEVTTLFEVDALGFYADGATELSEGTRLGIFGRSLADNVPRVIVLDLSGQEVVVDVELDTDPPVINISNRAEFGWVEPAWDRTNGLMYVPHLYSDFITSVDLNLATVTTSQVTKKTSFLDGLLAAWVPTAHAKGPSSRMFGALAPDGATLYLTGKTLHWVDSQYVDDYREMPAGIVAIDTKTMTEVARANLPSDQFAVSPDGELILAAGWWEESTDQHFTFGSSGLHLLDADTLVPLLSPSFEVGTPFYELAFSADGRFAYATERDNTPYAESTPRTIIIDTTTFDISNAPIVHWFHSELLTAGYLLKP